MIWYATIKIPSHESRKQNVPGGKTADIATWYFLTYKRLSIFFLQNLILVSSVVAAYKISLYAIRQYNRYLIISMETDDLVL